MVKKKKSSFRGKVSANAQKTKSQGASYGYLNLPKSIRVYGPTPGAREKIDILPYTVTSKVHPDRDEEMEMAVPGTEWYKRPFKVHKNVGIDNDSVVCLTSFGKRCPICDYKKERAAAGAEKDELKEMNASQRNLYYVIPRGVKKLEEEVHVFDFSNYLFQELLTEELEENEDYEIFPDIEEGLTLRVRWSEESFNGKSFAKAGRIDFLERDEAIDQGLVDKLPDLDSLLQEMSYDALRAKFFEMEDEEPEDDVESEEEEEEEEKPTPKKKAAKKKAAEPEEEDYESDELDWDDLKDMDADELFEVVEANDLDIDVDDYEEEEALRDAVAEELGIKKPTPKKKAAKKKPAPAPKKKAKEEEVDDVESEEEEEEEEKPTPKKKAAKKKAGTKECPGSGTFGVDTDELDECDDCPLWDECFDKKEEV